MSAQMMHTANTLAGRAMSWLQDHRDLVAVPPGTSPDMDDPDGVIKPLVETALTASLALREAVADTSQLRAARELLDFCWRQTQEGELFYERQWRNPLLTDPLESYVVFAFGGHRHPGLEELAAHNAAAGAMAEAWPNRRLAVANAHRAVGIDRPDNWEHMIGETWLGSTPQPWAIDWLTAYAMTHTVFHATNWSALPQQLPADTVDYLTRWLPVWIDIWSEAEQWDLVGELLIVGVCLPHPRCEPKEWERLAAVQHSDGLMPRDGDAVTGDRIEQFAGHHHPTTVAAIGGSLALARLAPRT